MTAWHDIVPAIAAYQGIGAQSYARSRINLIAHGTYDLIQIGVGTPPAHSAALGWTNNADTGKVLNTGITANMLTASMMIRVSGITTNGYAGGWLNASGRFALFPRPDVSLVTFRYGTGDVNKTATVFNGGTLALAGGRCYINGVDQGLTPTLASVSDIIYLLGFRTNGGVGGPIAGSVQAAIINDGAWTGVQVSALHTAMMALTSADTPNVPNYSGYTLQGLTSTYATPDDGAYCARASLEQAGTTILAYVRGTGHTATDGYIHMRASRDYGATWSAQDTWIDGTPMSGLPLRAPDADVDEVSQEPWLYRAPNGDLLCHMWRDLYGVKSHGTYQSRSTDGGHTWLTPAKINFLNTTEDDRIFATDDHFIYDGTIYAAARKFATSDMTNPITIFIKSADNGATWEYVSDMSTLATIVIEVGFEYVGNGRIVAMHRDGYSFWTYKNHSDDMGLTWSPMVQSIIPVSMRHRMYTRAHLQGEAEWWNDPVLIMCGFLHLGAGGRQNAVWLSIDAGATWSDPLVVDTASEDGGYGDLMWDVIHQSFAFVSYYGTRTNARIKRYSFAISGIDSIFSLSYQGNATIYDMGSPTGSISGGTAIDSEYIYD